MIESLTPYIPQLLIAAGIILLAVEVAILGFATFVLFFVGMSMVLSGSLIWFGIIPDSLMAILLSNAVISALLAIGLWKPLKNLQGQSENKQVKSDFDGVRFFAEHAIDNKGLTTHKYSGIEWKLKSDSPIPAGCEVEVVKVEVGTFWVKAV
ncbi:hypothetical protein DS2_06136 [Catenovulum agarivorans DS-2]|uniref:Uncharacterized protein n=1 Tax=Catenovulum agarivorans DS-2 TaxID=1328313 RepID=W7QPD6_9ALTE|nr:NfeD family protein [Catenovulum agarivorans]EWH10847.1 hypothetical protein DS2_06136 [Catenovulum agarivorans DS-2]